MHSFPLSRDIYESTRGVVFLGTPHRGSGLADFFLNRLRHVVLPSIEVNELQGVWEDKIVPTFLPGFMIDHTDALPCC